MASRIQSRLAELGVVLPVPAVPVANYVPTTRSGSLLVVSGQLPMQDGKPAFLGKLGDKATAEQGYQAARICFINVLAQVQAALDGDLDRVVRVLRLGGFASCVPSFSSMAACMNGASDLAVEVFGDAGRHARSTIGVAVLPSDATFEVEAMFEVR